jgi:alkylation response protein AidB-like acyl-CoA dehydrogenase
MMLIVKSRGNREDRDARTPGRQSDVNLSLTDTEEGVRELFASFFEKEAPFGTVRRAEPLGFDQDLWDKLCQMGAPAMGVPESLGGGGATSIDLVLAAEQYGRSLAPVPLVDHVAATRALAMADCGNLLSSMSESSTIATLVLAPVRERVARLVPAGAVAEVAILLDGDELVALRRRSGSRPHVPSPKNLGCSPIADWSLDDEGLERSVLAVGVSARDIYGDAVSTWRLLTAAALNGLAARALEIAVDYVKERKAFGVPIGTFQSVRHRLADLAVAGDGSTLLAYEAAWASENDQGEAQRLSKMAFIFASETAFRTCREALQFHGGYGVTLEYDIQLFFRRAKAWPLAIGDLRDQYRVLGDALYPTSIRGTSEVKGSQ